MTLQEFRILTSDMPPSTIIHVMAFWGDIAPAAMITIEDLVDGDPVKDSFPPDAIVLTEEG